jgi:hypothetical protein
VRLQYLSGRHGIATCAAALLADGTEVARDTHPGWTGGSSFDNVYTLQVPQTAGVKNWTLVVTIDGRKGTDATGDIAVLYESE